MAKPVVIDDGGSVRIRQLKDFVAMDGLIGTPAGAFQDHADEPFGPAFQCTLTVRYFEVNGAHQVLPAAAGLALLANDTVTIRSSSGLIATITFDAGFHLSITLNASANAKQGANRRSYVVTDTGQIALVSFARAGVTTQIYPDPAGAKVSIFTMVHFNG